MILNDEPNSQVSRILMNTRPIYVKRSGSTAIPIWRNLWPYFGNF
jgi:hypothetical protein